VPNATQEFDVVIVGAGGSGLAAGARCAELGLSVVVLEKQPRPGGTTGIAVGSFTANRTEHQRRAGIDDTLDDHAVDAGRFAPPEIETRNNDKLRRYFLSRGAETLDWLSGMGLTFHGPSPEPPNRAPRMHNVVPNAKAYIAALQSRLLNHGGRVVLAAGDYTNAPDLIQRFKGEGYAAVEGINPHALGDGHRLAEQAGAKLINMDVTYGPELRFVPAPSQRSAFTQLLPASGIGARVIGRLMPLAPKALIQAFIKRLLVTWQHPENSLFDDGAILVNQNGERFCDERDWPGREIGVAEQPGKIGYALLDERLIERYSAWPNFISTAPRIAYAYVADYLRLRPDVATEAGSLESLEQQRGLPPGSLKQAVKNTNTEREQTGDAPLEGARWILLGPMKAYFTTTEGGAAINRGLEALDADGRPIPGLYAIGQNGLGGQILWGHGLHIAWAITSGRLVAEALARVRQENQAPVARPADLESIRVAT
jgi:fumarate reductase flavoprotein subunit